MTTNPTKRRGQPPKYVIHNGQPVVGLSRMPATVKRKRPDGTGFDVPDGRYYLTGTTPRAYVGTDFATALHRLEDERARRTAEYETITVDHPTPAPELTEPVLVHDKLESRKFLRYDLPSPALWAWFGKMLRSNPEFVARKTGVAEIAFIRDLKAPTKLTLAKAGEWYFENKRADYADEREWRKVKAAWQEFADFAALRPANHVEQLDSDLFLAYATKVKADQQTPSEETGEPRANSYTRLRFGAITAVLNYCYRTQKITPATHAALRQAWNIPLKQPPQGEGSQTALTHAEFQAMLKAASDDFDKALLLLGLNGALYPIDLRRLQWRHVNLDEGTLVFRRAKKNSDGKVGTLRVAVLWAETVKALRKLLGGRAISPNDHVFSLQDDGSPVHVNTVGDHFQAVRVAAKVKRDLSPANLRDSFITISSRKVSSAVFRVVAGHNIKDEDRAYIERNPFYVQDACNAVYAHYFPAEARCDGGAVEPKVRERRSKRTA